ncbi:DUF523 domain-containing protein [Faecalicatena contorta]|uniref:Uncharacterized conserved protein YbbK, DUF523 family n=1 Tax=Faecalicatena contorta TaxID=39482 RepID=A0A316A3D7_9FIRM|nr:DUF523 domain-containing protein [Faecalicatena contorta]PWJ52029.1 uncharacterized protein YbbK (DUF523 family) [Faecalicatena contorta]SUQ12307.1 Uncharacterized conserved protein YbbK, DUF523 family [Faecalicatena contorta]
MKVLVSACVLGCNCKYNGRNNRNEAVMEYLKGKEVLSICPEMLANMPIPRTCAEIVDGVVMDDKGNNVDSDYRKAVALALEKIEGERIDLAILQSRSPTCGVNNIYDGTFTGKLVSGQGLFAKALIAKGYPVKDAEDFNM